MNFLEDSSYHSPTILCTLPMGKFSNLTIEDILECLHASQIMYPLLSLLVANPHNVRKNLTSQFFVCVCGEVKNENST